MKTFRAMNLTKITSITVVLLLSGIQSTQASTVEVIVDNEDASYAETGRWNTSNAYDGHAGSSRYTISPQAQAIFTPTLPRAGRYEVFAWWSRKFSFGTYNGKYTRASKATFTISHAGREDTVAVNQNEAYDTYIENGQWVPLGAYDFTTQDKEHVRLSFLRTGLESLVADAVLFRLKDSSSTSPKCGDGNLDAGEFCYPVVAYPMDDTNWDLSRPVTSLATDVNGDGLIDFISSSTDKISVALGSPTDVFSKPEQHNVDGSSAGMTYGDVDNDGFGDIVRLMRHTNGIQVLRGNGGFDAPISSDADVLWVPPQGRRWTQLGLRLTDFDGDQYLDLLVATAKIGNGVAFLRGNGDGTFSTTRIALDLGSGVDSEFLHLVVGDWNGDGNQDFAVSELHGVSILLGTGGDNFFLAERFSITASTLDAKDIDMDNDLDIVVASYRDGVTLLENNGDGTFAAKPLPQSRQTDDVMIADISQDGHYDLVLLHPGGVPSILLGDGQGNFDSIAISGTMGKVRKLVATADVDSNGTLDLLGHNRNGDAHMMRLNQAFNVASQGSMIDVYHSIRNTWTVDLNGDGYLDVISCGSGSWTYEARLNNGTGNFGYPMVTQGCETDPQFTDVTNDGITDILAKNGESIIVRVGNGDGTFSPIHPYETNADTSVHSFTSGDFDNDGLLDILSAHRNSVVFLRGTGDPANLFTAPDRQLVGAGSKKGLVSGDLNSDGHVDIVLFNQVTYPHYELTVVLGDGSGKFSDREGNFVNENVLATVDSSDQRELTIGDMDNDGRADIVARNFVMFNDGNNTFTQPIQWLNASSPYHPISLLDIDRDGNLDLVTHGEDGTMVTLGNGDRTPATFFRWLTFFNDSRASFIDLNNDGALDIIYRLGRDLGIYLANP